VILDPLTATSHNHSRPCSRQRICALPGLSLRISASPCARTEPRPACVALWDQSVPGDDRTPVIRALFGFCARVERLVLAAKQAAPAGDWAPLAHAFLAASNERFTERGEGRSSFKL